MDTRSGFPAKTTVILAHPDDGRGTELGAALARLREASLDRAAVEKLLRSATAERHAALAGGADAVTVALRAEIVGRLVGRAAEFDLRIVRASREADRCRNSSLALIRHERTPDPRS